MKNFFTFLLLSLLFINNSNSQEIDTGEYRIVASIAPSFWMGFPAGKFQDKMDATALGVGINGFGKIKNSPIWLGGNFGYLLLDREKKKIQVEVADTDLFEKYNWRTAVESMYLTGMVRFQPALDFFIWPYVQFNAGARRLYTRTSLHEAYANGDDDDNNTLVDAKLESEDWGFTYGGTAGLQFYFTKNKEVGVDVSCNYMRSGAADFFTRKNNVGDVGAPIDAFEPTSSSATDMLMLKVGLVINLPGECE